MNKLFRPMLAATLEESDLKNLTYPLILQPKLDGIRCVIVEGKVLSRKLKPIPNRYIRASLERFEFLKKNPVLIDGELIIEGDNFNEIQSSVMSEEGIPPFTYKVFDCLLEWNSQPYEQRMTHNLSYLYHPNIEFLNSAIVHNLEELLEWETYILKDNYEGIIIRSLDAPYKFGRSTLREQGLMKFKRFQDSEAVILSSNAFLSNANPNELDNLGLTKHSSAKANLIPENKLGSFIVRDCNKDSPFYQIIFALGTGFTEEQRKKFWFQNMKGKIIKYKYQKFGSKNAPRIPVFIGFRED
ncbi:MAG TPA: hypothetical protein VF849_00165 [Blattabacteriaceae bacterium]